MTKEIHVDVNGYLRNLLLGKTIKHKYLGEREFTVIGAELTAAAYGHFCEDIDIEVVLKNEEGDALFIKIDEIVEEIE